jgi:quinol monooxygenase YgiN
MSGSFLTPHKGVTFSLKCKVDPMNIVKFTEALRKCWESTECLYFEVFHSPTEIGTFRLVEIWTKDLEWIEKHHLPRDYYQQYRKIVEPLVVIRGFEVLDRLKSWNVVDKAYLAGSIKTKKQNT